MGRRFPSIAWNGHQFPAGVAYKALPQAATQLLVTSRKQCLRLMLSIYLSIYRLSNLETVAVHTATLLVNQCTPPPKCRLLWFAHLFSFPFVYARLTLYCSPSIGRSVGPHVLLCLSMRSCFCVLLSLVCAVRMQDDLPVDPNEPVYCLCMQVSYGEMVGCDNPSCENGKTPPRKIGKRDEEGGEGAGTAVYLLIAHIGRRVVYGAVCSEMYAPLREPYRTDLAGFEVTSERCGK